MKNMRSVARSKRIEIVVTIIFVLVSIPLWKMLPNKALFAYANELNNSSYAYTSFDYSEVSIFPMYDETAINTLEGSKLQVINETYQDAHYTVALRLKKTSTIDYNIIKIAIDNEAYSLKDLYMNEDDEYYYFKLCEGRVQADTTEYNIKLWLEYKSGIYKNKTIIFDIVNLEGVI